MTSRFLVALSALALATPAAHAALSPAEQKMLATVDAEQARTVNFLQRIVDQNSGTMNIAGVQAVRAMVEPEFQQLGFKTEFLNPLTAKK